MSNDKTGSLADLGRKLKSGLGRINQDAKDKAAGKPPRVEQVADTDDIHLEDVVEPAARPHEERLSARDDDIDDAYIIEGESQTPKTKNKGLGTKQKVILLVTVIAAAWWWTNNKGTAPTDVAHDKPAQETQLDGAELAGQIPGPTFELGSPTDDLAPSTDRQIEISKGAGPSATSGLGSGQKLDAANEPIGSEILTADLNEQLGSMADDGNETLDPFSGEVRATNPAPLKVAAKEESPKTPEPKPSAHATTGLLPGPDDSPFSAGSSNDTELSGTKNQKADSKGRELLDQSANADVANLKANLAEKDGRIGKLEAEMGKLKTELATAKDALAKPQNGHGKSTTSKAPQQKPAQAAKTTQRSAQTQRVATAPKVIARPQICVTAVAQAARNCTTCVPHAFIFHNGIETSVGQGDFLEKLRVNIVGDRLDLQNAQGDVVHKFWSSPNGCAAG